MAFQPVPWAVGGGAKHSPEVARVMAHSAAFGHHGIILPDDCLVKAMDVPTSKVRVMPGAVAVKNNYANAERQMYFGLNQEADEVPITPTGSSGGRTDLVYTRIRDPQYPGNPSPPSKATGPYQWSAVLENVDPNMTYEDFFALRDASNNPYVGEPFALIDIPVSTSAIQESYIRDIRRMANPHQEFLVRAHNQTAGGNILGAAWEDWPLQARWDIDIPSWAVRAHIIGTNSSFRILEGSGNGGNLWGDFRASLGSGVSPSVEFNFSMPAGLGQIDTGMGRVTWDYYIPKGQRGTKQPLAFQGKRDGGNAGCDLETSGGQAVDFFIVFYEAPDQQGWG